MRIFCLILLASVSLAFGFTPHSSPRTNLIKIRSKHHKTSGQQVGNSSRKSITSTNRSDLTQLSALQSIMDIRGGATAIIPAVTSSLQNGSLGILSMWAIASAVVIPLTLYRQAFSFSVGYGYSVMAMGLVCLLIMNPAISITSAPFLLVASTIFYGFRLGSFLVLRNATVPSKAKQLKSFDKSPPLQRIPLAINVALLYAFMTSPAMFALQTMESGNVAMIGATIAWIGAIMEAVADGQKFLAKRGLSDEEAKKFVGPTGGFYQLCRHPNYLGEVLFWLGLYIGGIPSFGSKVAAWICTSLGLTGIVFIMKGATKRLDKQQAEKYSGEPKYDDYVKKVPFPLIPFVKE